VRLLVYLFTRANLCYPVQMLRYIENNLLQHEQLIYGVKPHWIVFSSTVWMFFAAFFVYFIAPSELAVPLFGYSLTGVVSLALTVVGVVWGVRAYIYFETSEYGVTNRRVLIKIGWIKRVSLEIMLEQVEGVYVDQTMMGRAFNYGAITIIGTGGTKDRFPYIPDPLTFRRITQQQIDFVAHPQDAKP